MLDYNPDLIADALDEFRAAESVAPQALGGAATVRATVKHRRRVKAITFSVLGALLVTIPIAAFAAHPRGNNPPPVVTDSGTPDPSPEQTPTTTPSPVLPPTRDAKFTAEQLKEARLPVPNPAGGWACGERLRPEPKVGDEPHLSVRTVAYTNLDQDPALETAALLVCNSYDSNESMVLAVDMDAAGAPMPLGVVYRPTDEDDDIIDLGTRQGGGVVAIVEWREEMPLPGKPDRQHREFAWDGTTWKQVGGPTAFPQKLRTDMEITSEPLVLGPVRDGKREGSTTVTVTNLGPNPSQQLEIEFGMNGLRVLGEPSRTNICKRNAVNPGTIANFYINVEVDASNTQPTIGIKVHSFVDDPNVNNNYVTVAINRL